MIWVALVTIGVIPLGILIYKYANILTCILIIIGYCMLAQNAHVIFQEASSLKMHLYEFPESPYTAALMDIYYVIMDYSVYSVNAVAFWIIFLLLLDQYRDRGFITLLIILPVYYTIDCWNTLLNGNYDGLGAMLMCMGTAIVFGVSVHLWDNYKIIRVNNRNRIGF